MIFQKVKIGSICTLVNGIAFKSGDFQEEGIPVLKIANVKANNILLDNLQCVSEEIAEKKKKGRVYKGDILLTMTGNRKEGGPDSWVGKAALFRENGHYMLNQRLCIVRPDTSKVNTEYLAYYLSSWDAQLYFINHSTSSGGQANISPAIINDYEVALPSLEIQRKIAHVLTMMDLKIRANVAINRNLSEQVQAIYESWFVSFEKFGGVAPLDWEDCVLGDIAEIKTTAFKPDKEPDVIVEHYSIPALDEKHFPVFELAEGIKSNKYLLNKNSVMISKLNPDTKRVWRPLCLSDKPVCSTEFIVFEAKNKKNKDFIFSILNSDKFNKYLCSHVTGSTGSRQRAVPKATLDFKVLIPPLELIEQFCSMVTPVYDLIGVNEIENQRLAEVRDSLLPKLMSGELDISDLEI